MRLARGERHAQRLARPEQVLLADDLVDGMRAQALRQRHVGGRRVREKRSVHAGIVAETATRPATVPAGPVAPAGVSSLRAAPGP